ncbi:MAG: phosphate acyltransferase PlsX [Chthonomonadales bacterium]|nr:phosphate acyltransferase PlsX [Chthonomonadales bacterium]
MTTRPPRIAIDAMGGDRGPAEVVRGAVSAARGSASGAQLILVGDSTELGECLRASGVAPGNVRIHHASQTVSMHDRPSEAIRGKPDASVSVAARLVKDGEADGFISIGNTGAAMAAAFYHLRPVCGISRPAIAAVLPTMVQNRPFVMLDMGANVDGSPHHLVEFAIMGLVYARKVLARSSPRVALLSNGEEPTKGNDLTKRAHALLREYVPEFSGNIEAGEAFRGSADVVVCDGFDGNVLLKGAEGVVEMVLKSLREELTRHPWMRLALLPLRPSMSRLRKRLDYREFGGAPLLGVNGVCIIGHGRSDAVAVANAIKVAVASVGSDLVLEIARAAGELRERRQGDPA